MPEKAPEDVSAIFRSKPKALSPPPPVPSPAPGLVPPAAAPSAAASTITIPPIAIPSAQQLGGMLNGLVGNVFENNNWWLWAALLFIFFNPDLRKKLVGKGKEAD